MTGAKVVELARAKIGTPFRHQGRMPGAGLDCVGLVVCVAAELGIQIADRDGYGRTPSSGLLEAAAAEQPAMVAVTDDLQEGDLLLMRFRREPSHVAIYANGTIIHALEPAGKVCEHVFSELWQSRVVRRYRFRSKNE